MPNVRWTEEDVEFLKKHYMEMSVEELARHLGTTPSAVANKMRRLRLKKNVFWREEDIIERIRALRNAGESLKSTNVRKNYPALYSAACRHFGSWRDAVEEAGIDYEAIRRSL